MVEGDLDLPVLASATGVNLTLDNAATLTLANAAVTMPLSNANRPTINNVPELPHGMILTLAITGTFTGGTNINVAEGDTVALTGGTDSVFAGTFSGGIVFAVAAGATVNLGAVGILDVSGTLSGSGAGTVELTGSGLMPAAGGLTLDFSGGMFQWMGGTIGTSLGDLTNLGTINLAGAIDEGIYQGGTFYNYGTILQTGFSDLSLGNGGGAGITTFVNESGASYLIDSDSGIDNAEGGKAAVENAGTIRKIGGPGTAALLINGSLSNTGTIETDNGTLFLDANSITQVFGNTLTAGTWNALDGATLQFPTGTNIVNNAGNITLSGPGASITGIASLLSNSGNLTIGPGSTLTVAGNYTQTAAGTLTVQLGGTPGSSQFGQLAVTGTAALAGAFNLALVNGFYPTAGQQFNVISFTGSTGAFAQFFGLNPFFTETLTPTAQEIIAATGPVDLAATSVTANTTATPGQQITVNWQVSNPGSQAAAGSWQDSVYLSATPAITSSSVLLGAVAQSGGLAGDTSYNASLTAAVPALSPGDYYVLVQVDSLYRGADAEPGQQHARREHRPDCRLGGQSDCSARPPMGYSSRRTRMATTRSASLPAGALVVSLQSTASTGATALYVSQGSLPTPYDYQEAADFANEPNQTVTIPQVLTARTYYILAHSVYGASRCAAAFTLTATQTALSADIRLRHLVLAREATPATSRSKLTAPISPLQPRPA